MIKRKSKRTHKATSRNDNSTFILFLALAVLVGIILGALATWGIKIEQASEEKPYVSLGTLKYDFSSGEAVKRDTVDTRSLMTFLNDKASQDCAAIHSDTPPSQYQVLAANEDFSQVMVGYGCGNTMANMYAVQENGTWRFISPTNHFEQVYGFPECIYVENNDISTQIAPVCYQSNQNSTSYHVRDGIGEL